jgi:exodeoxyribonuclease V beta subunit
VDTALQRHAQALPGGRVQPAWPRMLLRVLHEVLHTPLADGLRLCDVPPTQRQTEMEFHLPAPRLDAQALGQWLRRQNPEMPVLGFGTLSGYLRGFIDLVFEHGGRYYLLDWKSNHLGDKPQHYAEPALGRVMQQQGYQLQGLLYALALHRHLQQRLAGYRHAQHFGGVFYLFVRGVRPHWTQSDGSPCGVHLQRPALQDLQALAALLDDARPAR